jgi:hypothetical protein
MSTEGDRICQCHGGVPKFTNFLNFAGKITARKLLSFLTCKQRSADIYHHKFEKWYRNAVVTKQPSEHYYLSHATFPFPPDRCTTDFWLFGSILGQYLSRSSVQMM